MGKKITNILIHLAAWLTYFLLNFLFIKNYRVDFDIYFHTKTWLIQIFLFYLNYYLLIPHFFFKKRLVLYLLFSLLLLSGFYYTKAIFDDRYFKKEIFPQAPEFRKKEYMVPGPPEGMNQRPTPEDHRFNKGNFEQGPIPRPPRKPFGPFNFLSVTGLLLIYTASFSIRLIQKWRDDDKQKEFIEKEKISTELNFLKQQINPHFLFNSLNSIYSLSMTHSPDTTEAILKLSSILRYILYEGEKETVPLSDELDTLKDYIDLQKFRITQKVKINYQVSGNYNTLRIEPLILLPLIENAFKHGVDNANESNINIFIEIEECILKATINNKKNKKKSKFSQNNQEEGGIGLKNLRRRLDLVYPGNHIFEINESENLFSVFLQINLRS